MKRNLLAAVATSSILALAAPPLALAQGGHHHHGARHASSHKRHGHRAHLLTFGGSLGGATGAAPTSGTPAGGAATVVSFNEGVLTIELTSDKSLVKGKVTDRTELECQPAAGTGQGSDDDQQQSGDDQQRSGDDQDGPEGGPSGQTEGSGQPTAHSSDVGDDQGEEQDEAEPCTTASLQPKAVVLQAELRIADNGVAEWEKIELQK